MNGTAVVTTASSSLKVSVSSSTSQVKMSPGIQTSSHSSVQLPTGAGIPCQKPVMRVSPMTDSPKRTSVDGVVFTTGTTKYSALLLEALSILVTLQFHMLNDFIV